MHCGDQPEFLPTRHGFDSYFGIPYSNDMGRQVGDRSGFTTKLQEINDYSYKGRGEAFDVDYPPLPLMDNETVCQEQPDQAALTERYVHEAQKFMTAAAKDEEPFFLYFAHMYVHLPIYAPDCYLNNSQNGRYGAAVEPRLVRRCDAGHPEEVGIDDNTMVIFTSDNGSRVKDEGGSNAPLRGCKGDTWEGDMRLPCIIRWPGTIPAGRVDDNICSSIDFLPTFTSLAGGTVPTDRLIDGRDCSQWWLGNDDTSPRDTFAYYHRGSLEAIRQGDYKLHFHKNARPKEELYNLRDDIGERNNIFADHPDIVQNLTALGEEFRTKLGDRLLEIEGTERRPIGRVEVADTLTHFNEDHPYIMAEYDLADGG